MAIAKIIESAPISPNFNTDPFLTSKLILEGSSQPAHDVSGTSPEGPLKVVTSGTYRGPSGDPQGTNIKNDNLVKKLFFRSNSSCITYLFLFFYRNNKFSKVLNGDFHRTSTGPNCRTCRGLYDGTFQRRPRDVCQTCFLNSTYKYIKLTLKGYSSF